MYSQIKVDSNLIPIPGRRGHGVSYPWDQLKKKGESFLVPIGKGKTPSQMISRIMGSGRNKGYTIVTRSMDKGIRVWRTS